MTTIKLRRDTAINWAIINPVLSNGEPGIETDTNRIKYGDGASSWTQLPYASGLIPSIDAVESIGTWTSAYDQIHVNNIKTRGNLDIATGAEYSYWLSVYENVPNNGLTSGGSVSYDSEGNLYTLGVVWDNNTQHYDTLCLKYDPDGNLLWRKAWTDTDGNPCGTVNQHIYIDSYDNIYWTSINSVNTETTYFGVMDTNGVISDNIIRLDNYVTTDLVVDESGQVYLSGFFVDGTPSVTSIRPGSTADWVFGLSASSDNVLAPFEGIDYVYGLGIYTITGYYQPDLGHRTAVIYNLDSDSGNVINSISVDLGFNVIPDFGPLNLAVNNGYVYALIDNVVVKLTTDLESIIWSQQYGTDNAIYLRDINFDSNNNVYITGLSSSGVTGLYSAKIDADTGAVVWAKVLVGLQAYTHLDIENIALRPAAVYQNQSLALTGYTEQDPNNPSGHVPSSITIQLPLDKGLMSTGTYGYFQLSDYDTGQTDKVTYTTATAFTTSTYSTSGVGVDTQFIPDLVLVNPQYVPVRYEIAPASYSWQLSTSGSLTLPGGLTLGTENGLVAPDGGYSQLADYDLNNFVWVDSNGAYIGTNANSSANMWTFDEDGNITLPISSRINSGGIGTTNSVEFGTVVATDPYPFEGIANITNSEIYMSGGSAESRIITDAATGSLIYTGVEHVEVPAFAGMVAVDSGVTSQYSINVDDNGNIQIGATQEGGTLTTTDYTAGIGALNSSYTINGLLANPYGTFITGLYGISMNTERGQVLFGGQPEECAPGLVSHFHIMKGNNYTVSTDLFFGDDYNYVKLPGADYIGSPDNPYNPIDDNRNFGVEIATLDIAAVDFQQYIWRFDTKGGLEFPDNSVQTTAWDYRNLENLDMDGGAASTVYTINVRFAEGGAAGTRFSKTDPNYNGANAYGAEPEFTLDGGRA